MKEYKEYTIENNFLIFECPNCGETIIVNKYEINCSIFRHGILKISGEQINPHLPKDECDKLYLSNSIYGCSKPFRILMKNEELYSVVESDYI